LRTSFRYKKSSLRSRIIIWSIGRFAKTVIAIDENTKSTLPSGIDVEVVHNSLHLDEGNSIKIFKDRLPGDGELVVGYVGNILHSKGVLMLLAAIRDLSRQGKAVRLEIVGGAINKLHGIRARIIELLGISDDASRDVYKYIIENHLENNVTLKGHVNDICKVYPCFDVLMFPSIFDSPGRPIFEAAFFGVPSVACISQPRADTFMNFETGISIPYGDHASLMEAISYFYENRNEIKRMGENAKLLAQKNFDPQKNALMVWSIYKKVVKSSYI
jgi:glycosyltransferase involved in cell wall biosynthesis